MDVFLDILAGIGINKSIFLQLAVVFVAFFMSRYFFVGKLQNIIETRLERTSLKKREAQRKMESSLVKKKELEDQLSTVRKDHLQESSAKKNEFYQEQAQAYKNNKHSVTTDFESRMAQVQSSYDETKKALQGETTELAQLLVAKIR